MALIEVSRPKKYLNPLAHTDTQVLAYALVQDRNTVGKIEDEYFAASLNDKFAFTNFTRDGLRAARDVLRFKPEARGMVIRSSTQHIAFHKNKLDEGRIGRVHHEHRVNREGARSQDFVAIFDELQAKWSKQNPKKRVDHLTYYGAVDTTADYFSAVSEEAKVHPGILQEKVRNDDLGKEITIAHGAKTAIDWVTKNVLYGPDIHHADRLKARTKEVARRFFRKPRETYLLESQRSNGLGIIFQNITDGGLSTMHMTGALEGMLGNFHKPIAYLEVQLGAIQAFEYAADMYPQKATLYKNLAAHMRQSVMQEFYMPGKGYFVAAVDRDERTGKHRKVETLSILGASVLNSDLFDNLPELEKRRFLEPIIKVITSSEFLTDAGLRTRAKSYAPVIHNPENSSENVAEYQGSWTVWPALNEDIILGLHRQGFHDLAEQIENRMVNFVHANSNAEYAFVVPGEIIIDGKRTNLDGLVAQNYKTQQEFDTFSLDEQKNIIGNRTIIHVSAPYPQGDQLWTASAVMRIEYDRAHGLAEKTNPSSWQHDVEEKIFSDPAWISTPILGERDLEKYGDNNYFFIIDEQRGSEIENELRKRSEEKRQQLSKRYRRN